MEVGQAAHIYGLVGEARSYVVESSHPDIISPLALNVDDNTVHGIQPLRITAISPGMAEIKIREWPTVTDAPPLRTYRIQVTG